MKPGRENTRLLAIFHTHTHTHIQNCKMEIKLDFSETWENACLEDHKFAEDRWTSISFEPFLNLEDKTCFLITWKKSIN